MHGAACTLGTAFTTGITTRKGCFNKINEIKQFPPKTRDQTKARAKSMPANGRLNNFLKLHHETDIISVH